MSDRLAARGVTLAPATINCVLNYARGGKSGQPLRQHALAQALVADPDIRALGIVVNDVLDPPIAAAVPIWPWDDSAAVDVRRAQAAVNACRKAATEAA